MSTNEQKQKFDCLEVTSVSVYPFKEGASMGRLKGLATIVLNDQLLVRGLRIMDSENGLRERIENSVLEKYTQAIG